MRLDPITPKAPRPIPKRAPIPTGFVITGVLLLVALLWLRGCQIASLEAEHAETRAHLAELVRKEGSRSAMLTSERNHLRSEAASLTSEVERLTSEVESATAAMQAVEDDNAALKRRLRDAQAAPTPVSRSGDTRAPVTAPSGSVWTREKVEVTLLLACEHHGIPKEKHAWLIQKGADIAYRESTYRTDARNGQHIGLFQFNNAWATEAQRLDPVWSCYRFVQVYKDGGEAKIRQHWASTY